MGKPQASGNQPDRSYRYPQLVAHRGCPLYRPENTLSGFQHALACGAQVLELDIQLSADGVPMVIHDATLERTAGIPGSVLDMSAVSLAAVSVHAPDCFAQRFIGEPVPRLADVVTLFHRQSAETVLLFVELKQESMVRFGREAVAASVVQVMASARFPWVAISFDRPVLELCRARYGCPIGWALSRYDEAQLAEADALGPEYLFVSHRKVPPELPALPRKEWRWVVYTLNETAGLQAWTGRGIDLLETDAYPRLQQWLGGQSR